MNKKALTVRLRSCILYLSNDLSMHKYKSYLQIHKLNHAHADSMFLFCDDNIADICPTYRMDLLSLIRSVLPDKGLRKSMWPVNH